jgi:hypothetical protein
MSLVFNTNLPRNGIDWRLFSPEKTSAYQLAINSNTTRTLSNSASLVSSPFSNASGVNSALLSNGDVLCSGNEGLYTFNPTTLQFTYKSNNSFLDVICLLDDGNVLCKQIASLVIINPNDGSYVKNNELQIIAADLIYSGLLAISGMPQTFTLNISDSASRYIPGVMVKVKGNWNSFNGTITSVTSNSITIQKTSQTGVETTDFWTISVIGQTSTVLDTFKSSILNFQKIPFSNLASQSTPPNNIYVLTDSSFNKGAFIDTLNWTISFGGNLNGAFKSSSKYSANTNSYSITFPANQYTKVISTRTTNAVAMSDGTNLLLIHPSGSITNSVSSPFNNNIFCLLPQINSVATDQSQGKILLDISGGASAIWNTANNSIETSIMSGSAPDNYQQPVQLLDGRIFLKPFPNSANPTSFLIYGGIGGFNPNVTLSPYFNKWN